jgi:hypothetical protein
MSLFNVRAPLLYGDPYTTKARINKFLITVKITAFFYMC